jgi:cytochrome P450
MTVDTRTPVGEIDLQVERLLNHDPFEALDAWRERAPFWCEDYGGFWVVARFEDVRDVLQDATTFASGAEAFVPARELSDPLIPSFINPPEVQKYRAIVLPHMTPKKVEAREPKMRRICAELIGGFKDRGHCDVIRDFARQYPIRVFSDLFGLPPERQEEFRDHAETFLHDIEHSAQAWSAIRAIVREQLEEKRLSPRDDLLSAIANGRVDGQLINLDSAINLASTVFVGGLDTLPSNIGWSFRYLANHPEARQRIINEPAVVPRVVEEFLRLWTVTAIDGRILSKDAEFKGVRMQAGDRVVVLIGAANHDSAEFDDPLTANFDRKVNRHIAFAAGPHRCLGSHLARHELEVALEEWHARIPDYQIDPDAKLVYDGGGVFAIDYLPLQWPA